MRRNITVLTIVALVGAAVGVLWVNGMFAVPEAHSDPEGPTPAGPPLGPPPPGHSLATFGAGCFWCTEAVFQKVKGVHSVQSGYSGGSVKNPTYDQVCSGTTGHAEVIQITFDPTVVSFAKLLEVFWQTHDPTTPNAQGNDIGSQYRSVVFYHNDDQRTLAEKYKQKLDGAGVFEQPIVTEIVPFAEFYPAEAYHQNFFQQHPHHPYCSAFIPPKLKKLQKLFKEGGGK